MVTADEYFWARVRKTDDCWYWTGSIKQNGYGDFRWYLGVQLHLSAHLYLMGKAPPGFDWDHTCHNADTDCPGGWSCPHRRCVRPEHLELVPHRVNLERGRHDYFAQGSGNRSKTHCPRGHEYTPENTRVKPNGWRDCRECKRILERQRRSQTIN